MKTISILGCGWLGLPLAEHFVALGYSVKGSTRSLSDISKLESRGIDPYILILDPELRGKKTEEFFDSHILIINFPPERREDIVQYHKLQALSLISHIKHSQIKKVIFVSSTSVYPDLNREVREDDARSPSKSSGEALLNFERLLIECSEFSTTVIRFAGLIGYNRKPGRFLSGKKQVTNGDAPVNLIHRDDCINIISQVIKNNLWGKIYNACSDIHPKRKDYYTRAAERLGITPPVFAKTEDFNFKIINSDKLKKDLNYNFLYPDPSAILESK
jgi:nucleoside-diphosphate-sugar epimerase